MNPKWATTSLGSNVDHVVNISNLHVLIPAPASRNIDLCKTILSGAVLDYPTPHLLHWNVPWDKSVWRRGYSSEGLVKLLAARDYLTALPPDHDRDLILIISPESTWFQLRPSVLWERYHTVTEEAERRLEKQIGRTEMQRLGIRQRVVFGATKECGCKNKAATSACCSAAPNSPLSKNMYRKKTDTSNGWDEFSSFRPRYLDTGFVMGPAADVRAIIERARDKRFDVMWAGKKQGDALTDQTVLSAIFAEQEKYRSGLVNEVLLKSYTPWLSAFIERLLAPFTSTLSTGSAAAHLQTHQNKPAPKDKEQATVRSSDIFNVIASSHAELGIHLDYAASLSHSTDHANYDARWLRYETRQTSLPDLTPNDCVSRHPRSIPKDIMRSTMPGAGLQALRQEDERIPLPPASWAQVTLYTDICTGKVPAMISHNGRDSSLKDGDWRWLWSSRFAQGLLTLQQRKANERKSVSDETTTTNTGGAWLDSNKTSMIDWWDLCSGQGFDKNLFVPW